VLPRAAGHSTSSSRRREPASFARPLAKLAEPLRRGDSVPQLAGALGLGRGVTGFILNTVPVALYAMLRHSSDFRRAAEETIACGGDTITTAAIVGALVLIGAEIARVARWYRRVARSTTWMRQLAQALVEGSRAPALFVPGVAGSHRRADRDRARARPAPSGAAVLNGSPYKRATAGTNAPSALHPQPTLSTRADSPPSLLGPGSTAAGGSSTGPGIDLGPASRRSRCRRHAVPNVVGLRQRAEKLAALHAAQKEVVASAKVVSIGTDRRQRSKVGGWVSLTWWPGTESNRRHADFQEG
jgi:hypothetical protein